MATMRCSCGRAVTACEVARAAIGAMADDGLILWNCGGCRSTRATAAPLRATAHVLGTMLAMRRAAAQTRAEAA